MNGELIRLALFGIFANYSLPPTSTIFVTFESPNSTSSTDILPVSSFSLNLFNILALRCFVRVYRTKHEFFGKEFTTVILYSDASYRKQMESYEKRKAKMSETLADLQRRLGSNRGKERDAGSLEWEVSGIIYKDFRSVFGYKVGAVPGGKKKPALEVWTLEAVEKKRYAGFGKTVVFTDLHIWHSQKIAKTYNQKYLVEDDFKLLNNVLLVPVGPINHHKNFNILHL